MEIRQSRISHAKRKAKNMFLREGEVQKRIEELDQMFVIVTICETLKTL